MSDLTSPDPRPPTPDRWLQPVCMCSLCQFVNEYEVPNPLATLDAERAAPADPNEVLARLRSTIDAEVRSRTALLDAKAVGLREALKAMVRDSHDHSNQNGCPDGPLVEGETGDPICQGCRAYVKAFAALKGPTDG